MIRLTVNGSVREVEAEPDTPLLWVIREQVGLTGTKYGCGIAQCGACTVHIDGQAVRSCSLPVSGVEPGQKIVTIEGLEPRPVASGAEGLGRARRAAMRFCQSGMIMAAAALLAQNRKPSEAEIRQEITNICRCGTYNRCSPASPSPPRAARPAAAEEALMTDTAFPALSRRFFSPAPPPRPAASRSASTCPAPPRHPMPPPRESTPGWWCARTRPW